MRAIAIVGLVIVASQAGLGGQESLSAARDLYASAAFEDALSLLTRLNGGVSNTPEIARQIDEYRAFCLYALGRTVEAESVVESIIRKEPLVRLDAADASPRVEMMFTNVRKRLLPSLIRERFQAVKSVLDEKDFTSAEPHLAEARRMIAEAENLDVKDEGLADLAVLVDGLLQLIRSTADDRRTSPARTVTAGAAAAATVPAPNLQPSLSAAPGDVSASRVYRVEDTDVVPPVVLDQRLPTMTPAMLLIARGSRTSGIVDVVIDEAGNVLETIVRQSLTEGFDPLLVRASRNWKYRPAMKDGVPVRYVKTILIVPPR